MQHDKLRAGHSQHGSSTLWTVVIPFKGSPAAKSRLAVADEHHPPVETDLRVRLSVAFLQDTVAAVLSTPCVGRVIVVTSDVASSSSLSAAITIVPDPGQGLNAAISAGLQLAQTATPDAPVAVLTGDLPTLATDDLAAALELAQQYPRGVVPDHLGIGTTMITGLAGEILTPRFGGSSHHAHQREGHTSLAVSNRSTLRQDVDTPRDLARALRQGVGIATQNTMHTNEQSCHEIA